MIFAKDCTVLENVSTSENKLLEKKIVPETFHNKFFLFFFFLLFIITLFAQLFIQCLETIYKSLIFLL
jgi:hypothetical protein